MNKLSLLVLLLGYLSPIPVAFSQSTPSNSLETRLEQVHKLIEVSSGAQQVSNHGTPESERLRAQARQTYKEAEGAAKEAQIVKANQLLNQASKIMFEAIRAASQPVQLIEKHKLDYENRLASLETLLEAYHRIRKEKKTTGNDATAAITHKVSEAKALYNNKDYQAGKQTLDHAYTLARVAVEGLRDGDTLIRELNFASAKEEYEYEIDRNKTHTMLVKVLVDGNPAAKSMEKQIAAFSSKAVELRLKAEKEAARGNYDVAITILEESTKNLVRAIRGAGIYIPG